MANLEFRIDAEKQSVDELYESIDKLEKQADKLRKTDWGLDSWIKQFDKFKRELKEKADEVERVKAKIISFNGWESDKELVGLSGQLGKSKKEYDVLAQAAVDATNQFRDSFINTSAALQEARKNVEAVSQSLIRQEQVVAALQSEIRSPHEASQPADSSDNGSTSGQISSKEQQLERERFSLGRLQQEQERAKSTLESFRERISSYQDSFNETIEKQDQAGFSLKKVFATIVGSTALTQFATDVVQVRAEFQQLTGYFSTLLQSKEKANALMTQMVETTAKTPFTLTQVAEGAQQLITYGFAAEDVNDTILRLGNVASGSGVPLERMITLYGTTMEQGRLYTSDLTQFTSLGVPMLQGLADMYGVSTEEMDKMVSEGKIGFPQVQQAIENMTDKGGRFYNLMEQESQTITGKINNLSDSWNGMLNKIGESQDGIINGALDGLKYLIDNYESLLGVTISLVAGYGSYRAALMTVGAIQEVIKGSSIAMSSAEAAHILVTKQLTKVTELLKIAQMALPYVAVATAVAGLVYVLYKLVTAESAAEKAQREYKERKEQIIELEQKHKEEINGLIDTATNQYETEAERIKALEELKRKYPEILKEYDLEKLKLADILDLKGKIAEADRKRLAQDRDNYAGYLRESVRTGYGISDDYMKDNPGANHSNTPSYRKFKLSKSNKIDYKLWLKDIDIDIQNDRVAEWISNLNKLTNDQIQAELNARERLAASLKNSKGKGQIKDLNGDVFGSFTEEEINSQIGNLKIEIEKRQEAVYTYVELKKIYEEDLLKARKKLEELMNDSSKYKPSEWNKRIEEAKNQEKAAKDALASISIKNKNTPKDTSLNDEKDRLEKQKSINAQLLDLRRRNQQEEMDLWTEGSAKKLAQIELDYENEKKAIADMEQEWKDAQNGTLTNEQAKEIDFALMNAWVKKAKSSASVNDDEKTAETKAMNEYLIAYGDYVDKRKAIEDKYTAEITAATTEGEKKTLGKEMIKSLSDLDLKANETTSAISRLFSDMGNRSVTEMRAIADEGEKALRFLEGGTWDEPTGKELNMSQETFDHLSGSPEELESIRAGIVGIRTGADECDTAFNQMGIGLKKIFEAKGGEKDMVAGMELLRGGFDKAMPAGQFLSGTLGNLGESFDNETLSGMATGLNVAMEAADAAMQGAQAGAMFGPMGAAAGAAVGAVTSLVSSFAKIHDAKNEKRILQLQDQIEVLDKSYEKLGESVEKAYSKDASALINQQNQLLEQQKVLIEQQIREEEDKKKTDNERIKEWREEQEEINKTLADNKEKAKDAVMGEDLKAAIDNFAQAYADAWSTGEDRAKSAKDVVKNMIKQMVMESLKAAAADPMKAIREKLLECWSDNYISDSEQAYLDQKTAELTALLDSQFGWADKYMKGEEKEPADGVSGQLQAAMTEGTASQLVGLWNSTSMDMRVLRDIGVTTAETVSAMLTDVREIIRVNTLVEQHTRRGADNTTGLIDELRGGFVALDTRLSSIERNTKASYSRG